MDKKADSESFISSPTKKKENNCLLTWHILYYEYIAADSLMVYSSVPVKCNAGASQVRKRQPPPSHAAQAKKMTANSSNLKESNMPWSKDSAILILGNAQLNTQHHKRCLCQRVIKWFAKQLRWTLLKPNKSSAWGLNADEPGLGAWHWQEKRQWVGFEMAWKTTSKAQEQWMVALDFLWAKKKGTKQELKTSCSKIQVQTGQIFLLRQHHGSCWRGQKLVHLSSQKHEGHWDWVHLT